MRALLTSGIKAILAVAALSTAAHWTLRVQRETAAPAVPVASLTDPVATGSIEARRQRGGRAPHRCRRADIRDAARAAARRGAGLGARPVAPRRADRGVGPAEAEGREGLDQDRVRRQGAACREGRGQALRCTAVPAAWFLCAAADITLGPSVAG
jgi:hypothetical protein